MIDFENLMAGLPQSGLRPARARGPSLTRVEGFGANPGALGMWVYAPPGLPAGAPLVVVLHGCGQTAQGYAEGAGWLTLADRFGFCVLCPEQAAANTVNRCFNWFEPGDTARDEGEAASIRQMVRRAVADHHIDRARIFVTGLSAGGGMTAVMLAAYPDVFAAGAIVAGLPYGAAANVQEAFGAMVQGRRRSASDWGDKVRAASSHQGPWPRVSIWHGDADTTVRPGAADDVAAQWIDVHGLLDDPVEVKSAKGRPFMAWCGADGEYLVQLHRLPGMGHGTPLATTGSEGCGTAGPFLLEVGVSSSLEIAMSWGIADARAGHSGQWTVEPEAMRPTIPKGRAWTPGVGAAQSAGLAADVEAVISKALRAAGLMK